MKNASSSYIYLQKKHNNQNSFRVILLRLFRYFARRDDLQVWQKKDRYGRSYWQACDPKTESKITLASEAEMRIWIEQRYYR